MGKMKSTAKPAKTQAPPTMSQCLDSYKARCDRQGVSGVAIPSILRRLKERFQHAPLSEVTTRDVEQMIPDLRGQGYAPASVQAHICYLRAAMRYAHKKGELPLLPYFPTIKLDNARSGFFEREEFERIVAHLSEPYADMVRFGYGSGWRRSEILGLRWSEVDRGQGMIRLQTSKNGHGRCLPLVGELAKIMERRWEARVVGEAPGGDRKARNAKILALTEQGFTRREIVEKLGVSRDVVRNTQKRKRSASVRAVDARRDLTGALSEWVFHHAGNRIPKNRFWNVWNAARNQAGLPGRLFHDLRRTAARDMIAAGCDYQTAMAVTGHRTMSMFMRYQIVDVRGIQHGLEALDAHRKGGMRDV